MAIRIQKQSSRRRGEAAADTRKRLRKLRSVKVTNLYRLSMRATSSRFNHRPVILSDDAMESSNSNSPNYMKATSCSNARRGPLQTSPATPEYNSSSSTTVFSSNQSSKILRRKNSLTRVRTSVKMPGNHVGDDRTPAIKSQKSLKGSSSLKRLWKMLSLKSRKSSGDGNITSVDPELCVNGTQSSSVHLSVSDEDATALSKGSGSEEISNCFLQSRDWHKQDSKIGEEEEPQRLEKSRSIKLKKLRSVRFRRRWSKSRLDQASVFVSGNEADMELMTEAQPHYMKATASQYVRKMRDQKPVNASKNTPAFKSSGVLKRVPSLRSRKSTLRKRAQGPPSLGNPDRPTSSSNHKSCNFSELVELQSGECESAETSTLHVCSYHYCSLHGHHNDPLPPPKGFVSTKRRSLKSQGRKRQPESRSPSEAKESRNVIKSKLARGIISSNDHVGGLDPTIVDTAAHGNHEDFLVESYIQSAEKLANEGIQKTDGEAVNRVAVKEMEGPQFSDVSSSPKVPDEKILNKVDVVAADSGLNLELNDSTSASQPAKVHSSKDIAAAVPSACAADKLDSTKVNEETYRSLSVPWRYPTVNADAASRKEIATDVLTDQQNYTNMWQLIYQHSISKIQPEVERHEITEAGDDQDADTKNIAEINELESNHEEKQELDMVSAVKLVQEAISAILQTHEHPSNHNSTCSETMDEEEVHSVTEDLCILPPTDSAKGDFSNEDTKKDKDTILVPKDMQQIAEKQCTTGQEKLESNEEKGPKKQMSKGFKKLRKVLAFTKFIRAMENLRRINPQKPRHLSPEVIAEGVRLRPLNMDERRSADEWMLDYALRQVISKLAPEEQRRVAHLVEAFETVNPELKEVSRKCSHMKTESVIDTASATTVHNKDYKFDASDHEIPDGSAQEQQKKDIFVAPGTAITSKEEISVISDNGDLRLSDSDHTDTAITMQNGDEKCVASDQNGSRFCDINVQKPDEDEKFVASPTTVQNQEEGFVADQERFTTCDNSAQKPEEEEKYVASVTTVDRKEEKLVASRHKDSATNACGEEEKFVASDHEDSSLRDSGTEEKDTKAVTFEDDALFKHGLQESNAVDISSLNKDLYDDLVSSTFNSHIHNQASTEGCRVSQPLDAPINSREKTDSCHNDKLLSRSPSNDDSGHGNKTNILKGILLDKQKYNSMWLLLIQQVQSSNAAEAEGQIVDNRSENGQGIRGITSFETVVDGEADGNGAGYKKLELTQSDADRLIQEALDGILRLTDSTVISKNPDGKPSEDTKGIFQAESEKSADGGVGESKISTSNDSVHDIFQAEESTAIDTSLEPENTCVSSDAPITSDQKQRGLSEVSSKRKISRAYSKLRKAVLCNKFIKAMENMQKVHAGKHECLPMEPDAGYQSICLRPCSTYDTKNAEQWMLDHALQKVIAKLAPSQQRRVALLVDAFEKVKPDSEKTSKEVSYEAEQIESVSSSSKLDQTFRQVQNGESYFGSENLITDGEAKESPERFSSINNNRGAPLYRPCTEQSKEEPAATKDVDGDCDKAEGSLQDNDDHNSPGAAGNDFLDTPRYSSMWNLIYRHIKSGIAENSEVQSPDEARPGGQADNKRQAFVLHQSSEADDDEDMETQSIGSTNGELQEQEAIKLVQEAVNELFLIPGQAHEEQSICLGDDGEETSITDGKAVEHEKMAPKSADENNQNFSRSFSKLSRVILCKRFIKAMDERRKLKPKYRRCLPERSNSERETVRLKHQGTNGKGSYDEWMLDNALQQVIGRLAPAQKRRVSMLVQAFETVGPQPEDENRRKVNAAA